MVRDEYIFEAFSLCMRKKASSPSAVKYRYGQRYEADLLRLADDVNARTYRPSTSIAFVVSKPKYREVFAADFRDRIIHHYVAMRLEPLFEAMFSDRTFNCRKGKGVLYGVKTLERDIRECSNGYTLDVWVVKADLKSFFMSIDKKVLLRLLERFIKERYEGDDKDDILWLTNVIVTHEPEKDCILRCPEGMWEHLPKSKSLFTIPDGYGLPIGNLSSQHFANFLLHWLDMFIGKLGYQYHGRYVDDLYYMDVCSTADDRKRMLRHVHAVRRFLGIFLHVTLHPDKFSFQHYKKGVPFTGAVVMPGRSYVSNKTVANAYASIYRLNRCFRDNRSLCGSVQSVNSYLGQMRHYSTYHIRRKLLGMISDEAMKKLYIKGSYLSLHVRKAYRICAEEAVFETL